MIKLSNPRREAEINDWPHGKQRVVALFNVESNNRGERVARITTGKPKFTTYHTRMLIVDGDDGRTYFIGSTEYDQMVLIPGTMKGTKYFYPEDPEYAQIKQLLDDN